MAHPSLLGIVVRNMEASLHFYRLLGLDIAENAESEQHVEVTVQGGFRIAWDTQELIKNLYPEWVEPVGHGMALAFECDNPTEVDALYNRIVEAGYQGYKAPWDAFWGQRYAVVLDPDGNQIDLFAGLE